MTYGRGRNAWIVLNSAQRKERKRLAALRPETPVVSAADAWCGVRGWVAKSPTRYACWRCGLYHEESVAFNIDEVVEDVVRQLSGGLAEFLAGIFSAAQSFTGGADFAHGGVMSSGDMIAELPTGEAILPSRLKNVLSVNTQKGNDDDD
jgi:hypothetical protein